MSCMNQFRIKSNKPKATVRDAIGRLPPLYPLDKY